MPETEVSMEEYVASRTSAPVETEKPAAITPPEKITTDPESATGTPESEEEKKAKGGGWQRRIDKLTKRSSELEETLKEEREARQRLEAKLAGRDPAELSKPKTTEPGARPKPKSTDLKADGTSKYADYDEFIEDLTDWKSEQVKTATIAEMTAAQKKAAEEAEQQKQAKAFEDGFLKRGNEYFEHNPDDKELMLGEDSPAKAIPAGSVVDAIILESEHGMKVLAHLCKNPDEIPRILGLHPVAQAREMMKIERTFESTEEKTSPEPKKASLPAPIKPISTSTSKSAIKPENMDMEDYARGRNAGTIR